MPTIPLINNGGEGPVPQLPAPVLDRERRPRVNLGPQIAGAAALGNVRPAYLPRDFGLREDAALGSVGRAIEDTGDLMAALARKQADAKNTADVAASMLELETEYANWTTQRDPTNPSKWNEEWQERSNSRVQDLLEDDNLSPAAREILALRSSQYLGNTRISVAKDAANEEFKRAKSATMAQAMRAIESQDPVTFGAATAVGREEGYLYDHEIEALDQRFDAEGERQDKQAEAEARQQHIDNITLTIMADPDHAIDILSQTNDVGMVDTLPGLDPGDIKRMKREAQIEKDRQHSSSVNQMLDSVFEENWSDKQIEDEAERMGFTERDTAKFVQANKRKNDALAANRPVDMPAVQKAWADVEAYDPTADDLHGTKGQRFNELFLQLLSATTTGGDEASSMRGALKQKLYAKNPFTVHKLPADPVERLPQLFSGIMGTYAPEVVRDDDRVVTNSNELRAFMSLQNHLWNELKLESERNPDKFREHGAVERWISERMAQPKMGKAVPGNPSVPRIEDDDQRLNRILFQ